MFVSGIGVGSILLLCVLDCNAVLTVWLSICLLVVANTDTTNKHIDNHTVRTAIKSNKYNRRIEPTPIQLTNI
jgi:UDP-N-acetylglucosamine transferase subunit ALG13